MLGCGAWRTAVAMQRGGRPWITAVTVQKGGYPWI